jgi:hypothetical protein
MTRDWLKDHIATITRPPGQPAAAELRERARAVLAAAPVRAMIEELLAHELRQPAYSPGQSFDATAWREGRRAMLMDLARLASPTGDA